MGHPKYLGACPFAVNFETGGLRPRGAGATLDFLLALWPCGSISVKACALRLPAVLAELECFPATPLPSLAWPEYGCSDKGKPSDCHAGVRAGLLLLKG